MEALRADGGPCFWAHVVPLRQDEHLVDWTRPWRDACRMFNPDRRILLEFELMTARRRAAEYRPFSPAWDVAMARVEELERGLPSASRAHVEAWMVATCSVGP